MKQREREERGEREREIALTIVQPVKWRREDRKMLWATKQLISLNLSTLHNATAHYRPIKHYNALLTKVY